MGRGFFASPLSETGEAAADGDDDALLLLPPPKPPDAVSARPTVVRMRLVGLAAVAMVPPLPPGELFTVTIVVPWCKMAVDEGDRLLLPMLLVGVRPVGCRLVVVLVFSAVDFGPGRNHSEREKKSETIERNPINIRLTFRYALRRKQAASNGAGKGGDVRRKTCFAMELLSK